MPRKSKAEAEVNEGVAAPEQEVVETVFPNGPSVAKMEQWKSRYKRVYMLEFDEDETYLFRTLNRAEFKHLKEGKTDQYYIEERMCELCCLWPENYNFQQIAFGKAGVPSTLAESIMENSGFAANSIDPMDIYIPIENGPTEEEYDKWKATYKKLWIVEFPDGNYYVFRSLNRKEFRDMQADEGAPPLYTEEKLCEKCVLWPKPYDFAVMKTAPAGVPTTLAELIMSKSGFAQTEVKVFE